MRILFVGPGGSVHTARWMAQLEGLGWELFLFPTELFYVRPEMPAAIIVDVENPTKLNAGRHVQIKDRFYSAWGRSWPFEFGRYRLQNWTARFVPKFEEQSWRLARLIERLRPNIIHSLGLHLGGYLALEAKKYCQRPFPIWVATNWGSDLFLFGRLSEHRERLKKVLADIDYYWCECIRDVELAKSWGVDVQRILTPVPVAGGFKIERALQLREPGQTSARKVILVKGYQDWAGRALVALSALRLCRDILGPYQIAVFTGGRDPEAVRIAAELLSQDTGVPTVLIPPRSPHEVMLQWHGRARISIGLSISDSIGISMLEAMLMGSFPIQSNTGAAYEWIEYGKTGFIVPPEDPYSVADAIRQALTDDELVDRAAEINLRTIKERCEFYKIGELVRATYESIVDGTMLKRGGYLTTSTQRVP